MFKIQNNPKLSSSWQSSFRLEHWDFDHWKFVSACPGATLLE